VESTVYLQDDVAIRVALEVSSIVKEVKGADGLLTYQIGTRNASTMLRLKDGETQVLAGLISDEDKATASRIPGLGELPVLSRLFGSQQDTNNKTEIVLSITPRVLRNVIRPEIGGAEFWSGTEAMPGFRPIALSTVDVFASDPAQLVSGRDMQPIRRTEADERISTAEPTAVEMRWKGPPVMKMGETARLSLHINSNGALRAMPFQAFVDPNAFEIVKVEEGDFFRQNEGETSFSSSVDKVTGKVLIGISRTGMTGVGGEGRVIDLHLKPIGAGGSGKVQLISASPIAVAGRPITPGPVAAFATKIQE